MGRARALEVLLSGRLRPEPAERYGWINRALPARSLAHRIVSSPALGLVVVKERVNAIALAPTEDFRRDSDLFVRACARPRPKADSRLR